MPSVRAWAARSSHVSAGGMCAEVQHSASRSMRSGAFSASHMPVMPPIDSPQNEVRSMPRWSSRSSTSRPSSAIEYGPSGVSERPWPRVS